MSVNSMFDEYFEWIYDRVVGVPGYSRLLDHLNGIPYLPSWNPDEKDLELMDENRVTDGLTLRYDFAYANGYPNTIIDRVFSDSVCSVLELMAALAIRCEEDIMDDPDYGDRTSVWFMYMLRSLKLEYQTDDTFDPVYVDDVIGAFLSRRYSREGDGGLFYVPGVDQDMRKLDLWYQMHAFLRRISF